ncbi:MAG: FkbM family methyltransferase [Actinobacteria bacterium]|nr:FkbM family methyltransferase [Actinomycetota bacterium]
MDSDDEVIGRGVFITGGFERVYMDTALTFLKSNGRTAGPGTTFVDVGANIGTSTVDALLHFGFARAVCFEPDGHNFRLLRANLSLNGLDGRARATCLALSSHDGEAVLERSSRNFGDHRILPLAASYAGDPGPEGLVACARFDSLVARGEIDVGAIGMIWIDAQGHETFVLEGAQTAVEAGVPIVVEYWPKALGETCARFDDLVRRDYTAVVDLRRLAAGVTDGSILETGDIGCLRMRYPERHLTDLLLLR